MDVYVAIFILQFIGKKILHGCGWLMAILSELSFEKLGLFEKVKALIAWLRLEVNCRISLVLVRVFHLLSVGQISYIYNSALEDPTNDVRIFDSVEMFNCAFLLIFFGLRTFTSRFSADIQGDCVLSALIFSATQWTDLSTGACMI
ncbi:Tyrosine-protein phosphatase [Dirofilaria immitis]